MGRGITINGKKRRKGKEKRKGKNLRRRKGKGEKENIIRRGKGMKIKKRERGERC